MTYYMPTWEVTVVSKAIQSCFPDAIGEANVVLQQGGDTPIAGEGDWEIACIRETLRGSPESFNPLVRCYAPRIRAYLFRMLRNREEAEDLTQETFIKAFRGLGSFDAKRPFRPWLYAIATNVGLNALRARDRRGTTVELDEETHGTESRGQCLRHPATPFDEREEALTVAMAQLSPRAARLVALHYQEGFTLAEAGALVGLTENGAKVALCRARQQLRKHMVGKSQ